MGGGKGGAKSATYKGNYSGLSPSQLTGMAPNVPQLDTRGMLSNLRKGTLATGQKIPTYQPGSTYNFKTPGSTFAYKAPAYNPTQYQNFQYSTPNISNIPNAAYQNVLNRGLEGIQQDQSMYGAQATREMGGRGLGRSGLATGAQATLARQAMQNAANMRSQYGLEQAKSQLDVDKLLAQMGMETQARQAGEGQFGAQFGEGQKQYGAGLSQWLQSQQAAENLARSGMDLQRQGMQSDENRARALQSLQAQLGLSGLQQQQIGTYGTVMNNAADQALRPWQMLASLYNPALGQMLSSGGKGDPFSALLGAGSQIGGAFGGAIGGPAGSAAGSIAGAGAAACLPKGTKIELEDGEIKAVEDIKPNDWVKGGKVLAIHSQERPLGHRFYLHKFDNGEVIMSENHPFFDRLRSIEVVYHDSPKTYDILTSSGHYYVNEVKLGSTIQARKVA